MSPDPNIETAEETSEYDWNLDAILKIFALLHNKDEAVKIVTINSLKKINKKSPEPFKVTPVSMMESVMFDFTPSSGMAFIIFSYFLDLETPEGDEAAGRALKNVDGNESFEEFIREVLERKRPEILYSLEITGLTKAKTKILRKYLKMYKVDDVNISDPPPRPRLYSLEKRKDVKGPGRVARGKKKL